MGHFRAPCTFSPVTKGNASCRGASFAGRRPAASLRHENASIRGFAGFSKAAGSWVASWSQAACSQGLWPRPMSHRSLSSCKAHLKGPAPLRLSVPRGAHLFLVVGISGELWLDESSDLGSWETWPLSGVFWVPVGLSLRGTNGPGGRC